MYRSLFQTSLRIGGATCEMETFQLIRYIEGGVVRTPHGRIRLICATTTGETLALFGIPNNYYNIDAVMNAGLPCTLRYKVLRAPKALRRRQSPYTLWLPFNNRIEEAKLDFVRKTTPHLRDECAHIAFGGG